MDTKYIRHDRLGFFLWDAKQILSHAQMAAALPLNWGGKVVSAGFVIFLHGRPHCMGGSTSLDLQADGHDSAALCQQLGLPQLSAVASPPAVAHSALLQRSGAAA